MSFEYTHAFHTPVFVSQPLMDAGVYRFRADYEPRDLHETARRALAAATGRSPWAVFRFGGLPLVAQAGTAGSHEECIRIGFLEDFDFLREAGRMRLNSAIEGLPATGDAMAGVDLFDDDPGAGAPRLSTRSRVMTTYRLARTKVVQQREVRDIDADSYAEAVAFFAKLDWIGWTDETLAEVIAPAAPDEPTEF
ncbi:MAG: hypothetical protein K2X82_30950 [Gemmataceae bacterium]|nr:hypothetical protein [Gemmataceae bacterium]